MAGPLITTVIPTYRRPAMLRRAIRSVLNQTFQNFQICVYDNASGDSTGEIVEEFCKTDSRVRYIARDINVGAFRNFQEAADLVETPFFSFLPDDDLLLPRFFEAALAGFDRHPQAAISILATLHVSTDGAILDAHMLRWPQGLIAPPDGMLACLRYGNPGLPAMLIRRDAWRQAGGLDQTTDPASDLDFQLRVGATSPLVFSAVPGAAQVMHSSASTANGGVAWVWPCLPRIIQKIRAMNLPPPVTDEAVRALRKWMRNGLIMRGMVRSIVNQQWGEADRAAMLLSAESHQLLRLAPLAAKLARRVPGMRHAIRLAVAARTWAGVLRAVPLQRQFRAEAKFWRVAAPHSFYPPA